MVLSGVTTVVVHIVSWQFCCRVFFLPQIVMTVYNMFAPIKYNIMK